MHKETQKSPENRAFLSFSHFSPCPDFWYRSRGVFPLGKNSENTGLIAHKLALFLTLQLCFSIDFSSVLLFFISVKTKKPEHSHSSPETRVQVSLKTPSLCGRFVFMSSFSSFLFFFHAYFRFHLQGHLQAFADSMFRPFFKEVVSWLINYAQASHPFRKQPFKPPEAEETCSSPAARVPASPRLNVF